MLDLIQRGPLLPARDQVAAATTKLAKAECDLLTTYRNDNEADLRLRQMRSQHRVAEDLAKT